MKSLFSCVCAVVLLAACGGGMGEVDESQSSLEKSGDHRCSSDTSEAVCKADSLGCVWSEQRCKSVNDVQSTPTGDAKDAGSEGGTTATHYCIDDKTHEVCVADPLGCVWSDSLARCMSQNDVRREAPDAGTTSDPSADAGTSTEPAAHTCADDLTEAVCKADSLGCTWFDRHCKTP